MTIDGTSHYVTFYAKHTVFYDQWIRARFLTAVADSGSHWLARTIVPNLLAEGVELF